MNFLQRHQMLITITTTIFTIMLISPTLSAWNNCPFGIENDAYPGDCGRYIDTNNDGICDQSQPNPSTSRSQESEEPTNSTTNENQNSDAEEKNEISILANKNIITLISSFFIILIGIIITKTLTKKQLLSPAKEKILWNIILLIFFMPSAITGVILILIVDFPFLRELGLNFIELHSYTSFFLMWISGYHIIWHTTYYIKGTKKLFEK